jgi:hypothetical protein
VTLQKEIVWEYVSPFSVFGKKNVFKIHRYAPDYPGLEGLSNSPNKPRTPKGPNTGNIGVEYSYTSRTSDPDGDQVYYWFDWDDGSNSGWVGPYNSGTIGSAAHIWNSKRDYEIRVKAKDVNGAESDWSDPLVVSMPKNKTLKTPFTQLLDNYPHIFPLIRQLLAV